MDWFCADSHLWHKNIIKYCERPFLAPEDLEAIGGEFYPGVWKKPEFRKYRISDLAVRMMNDALIHSINRCAQPQDTIWFLGDFLFGKPKFYYDMVRDALSRIRCKNIHMILGNHDHPCIADLFVSCQHKKYVTIKGQLIVLDHFCPLVWEKSHRGTIALYGHSHSSIEAWADSIMPGRRSMDVGFDNALKVLGEMRPFSFTEIMDIMRDRRGSVVDHHAPSEE